MAGQVKRAGPTLPARRSPPPRVTRPGQAAEWVVNQPTGACSSQRGSHRASSAKQRVNLLRSGRPDGAGIRRHHRSGERRRQRGSGWCPGPGPARRGGGCSLPPQRRPPCRTRAARDARRCSPGRTGTDWATSGTPCRQPSSTTHAPRSSGRRPRRRGGADSDHVVHGRAVTPGATVVPGRGRLHRGPASGAAQVQVVLRTAASRLSASTVTRTDPRHTGDCWSTGAGHTPPYGHPCPVVSGAWPGTSRRGSPRPRVAPAVAGGRRARRGRPLSGARRGRSERGRWPGSGAAPPAADRGDQQEQHRQERVAAEDVPSRARSPHAGPRPAPSTAPGGRRGSEHGGAEDHP